MTGADPIVPYRLSATDKALLKGMRIGTLDDADIADTYQGDIAKWDKRERL